MSEEKARYNISPNHAQPSEDVLAYKLVAARTLLNENVRISTDVKALVAASQYDGAKIELRAIQ